MIYLKIKLDQVVENTVNESVPPVAELHRITLFLMQKILTNLVTLNALHYEKV